MTAIKEFLDKNNQRIADLARSLGVRHCVARRWVLGEAIPNKDTMQKIYQYTGGQVTPNDFYDIDGGNNGKQQ